MKKTACDSEITDRSVSAVHNGRRIYFCEEACLEEFLEDKQAFIESDHFLVDFDILDEVETHENYRTSIT